ncbi:hypothetical protein EZ428_09020 [Pedobacter frigiditerrae]|uniref:Uncharacterized protein n=1 Tax=Pedobacter frigiditerrae TaxID=2530452 RepID=A0A4R0MXC4_9SPHI|nr:hypothetical protein [Pedobacter frigiditerrae]TCC91880.1 hypothetical protein EZ428_09020 [Pedobacter frigiditerrae]
MNNQEEQLNALSDIRKMMDRSSRFISLSGLSGVFAGITGLVGAYLAHLELKKYVGKTYDYATSTDAGADIEANLIKIAFGVLFVALAGGFLFTLRQTKKNNLPFWDKTSRALLVNLAIPLIAGAFFILALLFNTTGGAALVAPTCLVFYGLALINASKYTYTDIRFLGICEVILGIIALFNIGYGLYFWAFGFGVLHIIYGFIMYFKYERTK